MSTVIVPAAAAITIMVLALALLVALVSLARANRRADHEWATSRANASKLEAARIRADHAEGRAAAMARRMAQIHTEATQLREELDLDTHAAAALELASPDLSVPQVRVRMGFHA